MAFDYQVTRRVEFSETDMEGIVHYSNFFRYMETVEHAFFRSLGFSVVLARNGLELCLPRAHASCDFFKPLRFEDVVRIHLLVERKGSRSLTYQIRFYREGGGEVARGRLVVVCAARTADGTLRAAPLPPAILDQLEEAPGELLARDRNDPVPAGEAPERT